MKRKLLLACCALLIGWSNANAQGTWNAPEVPGSDLSSAVTGDYAIYNVKADAFMGEGMNHGTEALACRLEGGYSAALAARQKFTLSVSNGTVKMVHANHTDNDRGVGCASANANDIYADYGSNNQWTFAASNTAPDYGNVYNLSIAGFGTLDVDDKWGGKLTITGGSGSTDWAFIPEGNLTDGSFAKWVERKAMYDVYLALVASESTSTYAAALSTANAVYTNGNATPAQLREATRALIIAAADGIQQPTNVSALFTNANMQQDGANDWTSTAVDRSAGAIEKYHDPITLTQAKDDVPNGLYTLVFRGMVRQDGSGAAPVFNATSGSNSKNANVPWMTSIASRWNVWGGNNEWAGDDGSKIPDRLWRAAEGLAYDEAAASIGNFKVTGNDLTLTVTQNQNDQWFTFNSFEIIYSGPANLALYKQVLEKKGVAEGLVSTAPNTGSTTLLTNAINEANSVTPNSEEDALNSALTNLNNAITFAGECGTPYATFTALKNAADGIAAVEYTETESGSHSTFTGIISAQSSTANNATTVAAITTATSTLKTAIKTYVNAAEPKNDGEYFDITCLIENPTFENNNATGWSGDVPGFESYQNAEFFNKNFDFYQNITGLANGSYQLSVQAFCRPGDNGNETAGAYYDYTQGISNITAELYVNSDASTIGNIYSYKDNTTGAKVAGNDFHCNIASDDYWVPNNMKGAGLYFKDEAYNTSVAALVEDWNLKIGFREASKKTNQWVIFDNFRLYYYGSSKLVYYKQYLPQLKAEVTADLSNGAYANVLVSSEDEALDAALAATPASETEGAYKTVIDNLKTAQTAFRAAAPSYDAMVAAKASSLTKNTTNVGEGIFQLDETTNNSLYSAYETAKGNVDAYEFTTSSTAAGAQTLVDALDNAIDEYNNQPLNAPTADTHYKLTLDNRGALTFKTASTEGSYGLTFMVAADYLAQTYTLTAVGGKANTYTLSFEDLDGDTRYICTRAQYGTGGTGTAGIRTFVEGEEKSALEIKIQASSTANVFYMLNTERDNEKLGAENDGDLYTTGTNSNWSIAEASQAEVTVSAKAGKYGTIIFPFTPDVSEGFDGITFYSCNLINGESVEIEPIAGDPQANTPYIIKKTNGSDFSKVLSGWGTAAADSYEDKGLTGIYTTDEIPAGNYVLQTQEGVQKFYIVDAEAVTGVPYRAYLAAPASPVKMFNIVDGTATGVEAPVAAEAEEEEILYNTAGVRVGKDYKGIVINQKGEKRLQK